MHAKNKHATLEMNLYLPLSASHGETTTPDSSARRHATKHTEADTRFVRAMTQPFQSNRTISQQPIHPCTCRSCMICRTVPAIPSKQNDSNQLFVNKHFEMHRTPHFRSYNANDLYTNMTSHETDNASNSRTFQQPGWLLKARPVRVNTALLPAESNQNLSRAKRRLDCKPWPPAGRGTTNTSFPQEWCLRATETAVRPTDK